jgi:hypothetical protein
MENGVPAWAVEWLSVPRLAPYVAAAGAARAMDLYRWNCQLSSATFELIGWFEVAWRNAIDRAITARRPPGQPHWLFDQAFPLQPATRHKIGKAIGAVRRDGTDQPTSGQVIAELSLGFWRFTMRGYETTIWAPYLSKAFPHAPGRPLRHDIDGKLWSIILLRNRIAHHEPIFGRQQELRRRVEVILELGAWINPVTAAWWRQHASISRVLGE